MHWELQGEGLREQFTAASGEFTAAVEKMGREAAGEWLEWALMEIRDIAKEICPVDTGWLKSVIRYEIDKQALEGWVGADTPDKYGKCYLLWLELGTKNTAAQPVLIPALQQFRGEL